MNKKKRLIFKLIKLFLMPLLIGINFFSLANLANFTQTLRSLTNRFKIIQPYPTVYPLDFQKGFSLDGLTKECFKQKEFSSYVVPSLIEKKEYFKTINSFIDLQRKELLATPDNWLKNSMPDLTKHYSVIAQKVMLPDNAELALWGDLHGDLHSLLRSLLRLKKERFINDNLTLKKNFYLIFLGDFVDRGKFGAELLYVLMKLKLQNPKNVFMVRGNHDDIGFDPIFKIPKDTENFHVQLGIKFLDEKDVVKQTYSIFNYLPQAVFFGIKDAKFVNYIQCCHGGFELGYNALPLLESKKIFEYIPSINRATELGKIENKTLKDAISATVPAAHLVDFVPKGPVTKIDKTKASMLIPSSPVDSLTPSELNRLVKKRYTNGLKVGLTWHEFIVGNDKQIVSIKSGAKLDREILYGKKLTEYLLNKQSNDKNKLRAVFRGHQHHNSMLDYLIKTGGVFPMWNEKVVTLFSSPATFKNIYIFPFDSFLLIKFARNFEKWKYTHFNVPLIKLKKKEPKKKAA